MSAKEPDFILMQISLSSKTKMGEDDYNPCTHSLLSISCTNRLQLLLPALNRIRIFLWHTRVYDAQYEVK